MGEGNLAHPLLGAVGGGGAEAPQAPAPAVFDAVVAGPLPLAVSAVQTTARFALSLRNEQERLRGEVCDRLAGLRLSARHDQDAGHVVSAVAVLSSRTAVVGVLERGAFVGHAFQVGEAWRGGSQTGRA